MQQTAGIGLAGALALGVLAFGALPGPAHAQAPDGAQTVTSDGRTFGIAAAPRAGGAGSEGNDAVGTPATAAGNDRIGPFIDPLAGALAGPLASVSPESIIGADNRTKVAKTTAKPARMVALITYGGSQWCTGFLIGVDTLVTAGHCVYDTTLNRFYDVTLLRVYPGYDSSKANNAPYGSCTVRLLVSNTGWTVNHSDEYDYGAVKLSCTVGNQTGWFGWWSEAASLNGTQSRNNGYPGDKPLTQWKSTDSIRLAETRRLFYANDTFGGNSGSPIFTKRAVGSAQCVGWCVMAVHGYGVYGAYPTNTFNHGTRVTQDVSDAFFAWRTL